MTDSFVKYYKCRVCGQFVEYHYPVTLEDIWDNGRWNGKKVTLETARVYYKSVARYYHNMNHVGLLDDYTYKGL